MMGSILAASTSKSSGFNPSTLILILVVVVGFYMLMIRPQRRRREQAQQQKNQAVPGARVRTTAGMYATVVDVDGDDVVLEVAPGVEVRYMRRAIMDVVSPGEETEEPVTDSVEDTEEEAAPAAAAHNGEAPASAEAGDWTKADDWDKVDTDDVAESGTKSGTSKKD
jgi:preprotein translocase subunit YajC